MGAEVLGFFGQKMHSSRHSLRRRSRETEGVIQEGDLPIEYLGLLYANFESYSAEAGGFNGLSGNDCRGLFRLLNERDNNTLRRVFRHCKAEH